MNDAFNQKLAELLAAASDPENRAEFLGELAKSLDITDRMLAGLPKVVTAMDEIIEKLRTPPRIGVQMKAALEQQRQQLADDDSEFWKPEEERALSMFDKQTEGLTAHMEQVQERIDGVFKDARTAASSVRATARTQISLAKGLRVVGFLGLVYGMSSNFAADAAELAAQLEKGEDSFKKLIDDNFGDHLPKDPFAK